MEDARHKALVSATRKSKGVLRQVDGEWKVIVVDKYDMGTFPTLEKAAAAYDSVANLEAQPAPPCNAPAPPPPSEKKCDMDLFEYVQAMGINKKPSDEGPSESA